MALYKCTVSNERGKKTEILKEAASEEALITSFTSSKQFLVRYEKSEPKAPVTLRRRFGAKTVLLFTDVFSALLSSGLSVQDALSMVAEIGGGRGVRQLARELHTEVMHGSRLYDALSLFPSTFSPLYRGLARLGEKTGNASDVFRRISEYLHKADEIKSRSTNALVYPMFVLVFALLLCVALVTVLLPRMSDMLMQFGSKETLAVITRIHTMYRSLIFVLCAAVLVSAGICTLAFFYRRKTTCKAVLDRLLLHIPVLGSFVTSKQTLDFAFAMELLSAAGRTITDSLQDAALSVSNLCYRSAIQLVYEELEKGRLLSAAFESVPVFPPYVATWIKVGERSGDVSGVFAQIRAYFQQSHERMLAKLYAWIEPALIFVAGLLILFLVVNFVIPMFTMYGTVL